MNSISKICLVACALGSGTAWGHHSFAMFDNSKDVTLVGTVKELQLVNPHSWLQVLVKGSDGKPVEWSIEAGGPSELYRAGLRKSLVKPGDAVTVVMHPLRDGRSGGSLVSVVLADGTRVALRGAGGAPAAPAARAAR